MTYAFKPCKAHKVYDINCLYCLARTVGDLMKELQKRDKEEK